MGSAQKNLETLDEVYGARRKLPGGIKSMIVEKRVFYLKHHGLIDLPRNYTMKIVTSDSAQKYYSTPSFVPSTIIYLKFPINSILIS